jgi:hypothetical protein
VVVGATEGFGSGGLVAVGIGGGGSSSTVTFGEAKFDGDGLALLEFWFVFTLALKFAPPSIGVSPVSGEAETFAFALTFAF